MNSNFFSTTATVLLTFLFHTQPVFADANDDVVQRQIALIERNLQELPAQSNDIFVRYERVKLTHQLVSLKPDGDMLSAVIDTLEELSDDESFMTADYRKAELYSYLGSSYTLKARDFPFGWVLNNLTPLGFFRIYYVYKGVHYMDKAVEIDAEHPVVRLVRANTDTHLPVPFMQYQKGAGDFQQLVSWLEGNPKNETYSDIINDDFFASSVRLNAAQAYLDDDKVDLAIPLLNAISQHSKIAEMKLAANTLLTHIKTIKGE